MGGGNTRETQCFGPGVHAVQAVILLKMLAAEAPYLNVYEIVILAALAYLLLVYTCIGVLGCAKCYKLQALVANGCIIIPANILWTISFVVLVPLRLIFNRLMNMVMTTIISIFTIRPNFCNATFEKLLSSFPIGYKFILPGVNIMDIDELEARKLIRKRIQEFPFPMFRQKLSACMCTPNMLNSFVFRLIIATTLFPLLGWWLVGYMYIPFVPLFPSNAPTAKESSSEPTTRHCFPLKSPASPNDVCLEIPCCTFLTRAREVYKDEAKGNRACVNE